MPRQDGTGPMGQGAKTGRGLGPCGTGLAWGRGMGRGFGGCCRFISPKNELASLEDEEKTAPENQAR